LITKTTKSVGGIVNGSIDYTIEMHALGMSIYTCDRSSFKL